MVSATTELVSPSESEIVGSNQRYFAVPVAILASLPTLQCHSYIQHAGNPHKLLFRSGDSDLPIGADDKLIQGEARHLYLRVEDHDRFCQAMRDTLALPPRDPAVHLALTVEQHRDSFQLALNNRGAGPVVAAAQQVASDVIQVIKRDDFSVGKVIGLLDHDHCTFQHSCNVSIYAATLAKRVGLGDADVELLTIGGLLHDIGKRQIAGFILRKPGKLNDRERELIKQHPTTGFRELAALRKLTWAQLMMTYQHHEWINGAGYPVGIQGGEIHLWARVCAIADVFDALTANRPYRETGHAGRALEMMSKESGHFDPQLFQLWREIVNI